MPAMRAKDHPSGMTVGTRPQLCQLLGLPVPEEQRSRSELSLDELLERPVAGPCPEAAYGSLRRRRDPCRLMIPMPPSPSGS